VLRHAAAIIVIFLAVAPAAAQVGKVHDIPDFSWAGYHAGEKPLPARKPTVSVRDHGGIGDGKTDDTAALRAAIAAAAKTGGVVGVPAGRWVLTDVLTVDTDKLVIKGAGSGKTVLVCPKSLTQIRKPDRNWSWSGGMIELHPRRGASRPVATLATAAVAGTATLVVDYPGDARPVVGEWLEMTWTNDKGKDTLLDHLYGGVIPRKKMGPELQRSNSARVREWVRVAAVDGRRIRIAQPIRIDARPEWRVRLSRRPVLREAGVEGLAFEFPLTKYPGHLREKGYNGIQFRDVVNGWVRDVRTHNADSGIFVGACKHLTIRGIRITGRTMHHCISISWGSDCLVTDWRIEAPHVHGTTISWCAHGNVFSRGYGRRLAMDSHRAASFQNLHTDVVIEHGKKAVNPFRSGGSGPRGPHAAGRNVYWNINNRFDAAGAARITGYSEWPLGIFVAWHGNRTLRMDPVKGMKQQIIALNARPAVRDLHAHQLRRRLERAVSRRRR